MSYHDRRLQSRRMNSITGKYSKRNVLLKGAFSLTLFPKAPVINLGSIEDDWSAVGSDIRRAMNAQEACD